jgi:lysophospholipase L1-like esterase
MGNRRTVGAIVVIAGILLTVAPASAQISQAPPSTLPGITPAPSGNLRISPSRGVQGTAFSMSYSCPARTIPYFIIRTSNGQPTVQGFSYGIRVTGNGRDYSQTLTANNPGAYKVTLHCNNSVSGSADLTVTGVQRGVGRYVALGDSFSSGEGTYVYDTNAHACHRGPLAWPRLLESASSELGPIDHRACTGATTRDLLMPQKGKGVPAQIPTTPQLDVGLVTLTIGGNDVDFTRILLDCYFFNCDGVTENSSYQVRKTALTEHLARVIYPALERIYPNARIVHVGYPRLTPVRGQSVGSCRWLEPDEQDEGDLLVRQINGAIQAAVGRQSRVEYGGVSDILYTRELCTYESWVHELLPASPPTGYGSRTEQAHPNSKGQDAYKYGVASVLGLHVP